MKKFLALFLGFLLASSAFAADVSRWMTTDRGKKVHFQFHTNTSTVTVDTASASLRVVPDALILAISLWMPMDMPGGGHGSTDLDFAQKDDGSWLVTEIDFSMPGSWEVHVRFKDGDAGILKIYVDGG